MQEKILCFISLKVGIAVQEGLLSLDDPFMKYFPEYRNENTSERFEETTIRDMLSIRRKTVIIIIRIIKRDLNQSGIF